MDKKNTFSVFIYFCNQTFVCLCVCHLPFFSVNSENAVEGGFINVLCLFPSIEKKKQTRPPSHSSGKISKREG